MSGIKKHTTRILKIVFVVTWALLLAYFVYKQLPATPRIDVSLRLTSPDNTKTALLTREYAWDTNVRLYIVNEPFSSVPRRVADALWSSHDFPPHTHEHWNEDLEWSNDGTVIAVKLADRYVFAHDFSTGRTEEDSDRIRTMLQEPANHAS